MRTSLRVWSLAAAGLLLTGCDDWGVFDSQRFKEDFHYSYNQKPGGRVSLENMNGSIEITGWEKDTVEINGTKYASTESVLQGIKIDIVQSGDAVRIRTVTPSGYRGNYGARYIVRVPFKTELDRVNSTNGSIRVETVEGPVRLRTTNGGIRTLAIKGLLEAVTTNGGLDINDQTGSTTLRTTNGGIRADGIRGAFEAYTTNGGIRVRIMDPEAQRPVRLESSNGGVELSMDNLKDNDIRVSTSNSSITLRLPASLKAQLRAHTSNSSITTDFDVSVRAGQLSKSHLEGTIGAGGPMIDLSTSNGGIKVLRM